MSECNTPLCSDLDDTITFKNINPDDPFMPNKANKKNNNGGSKLRMKEINRIRSNLEKDIERRRKFSKEYKRLFNILQSISIGTSSIAAALADVTIGAMSNPAVILPLSITNVSLGATGTLTGVWSKSVIKRVKKHQEDILTS